MIPRLRHFLTNRFHSEVLPIGGTDPRGYVGGLWHEIGDLQFKFLIEHGLLPDHVLLDIACGSLRAGVRLIPFLSSGNYLGIDINNNLIAHGKDVELGETLASIKKPELMVSDAFEFFKFSKVPDYAIAQSLFTHLTMEDIGLCLNNLRSWCKPTTVLFATFFEADRPVANLQASHPHAPFRYTRNEMDQIGSSTGWEMKYIGEWNHPRQQMMLQYIPA